MLDCKPVETPMDYTIKLGTIEGNPSVDKGRYQRLMIKLIYLFHTRLGLTFSINVVSHFMNNPIKEQMKVLYRILGYLKMTLFQKNKKKEILKFFQMYCTSFITNRKSTSRYCTYIQRNLVTWQCKKQSVVAQSSAKVKFRVMTHGIYERMWLEKLLNGLKFPVEDSMIIKLP